MTDKEFTEIVESTKSLVLSAVRKYLFKSFYDSIDDVVQETYYKAYRHLKQGKFRGDAKITSWLYCIARNESNKVNRQLSKQSNVVDYMLDDVCDNISQADYMREKVVYDELMASLSERNRKAFELFVQHCPLKQISEELGINENTVKTIIYRTKKTFMKQLLRGSTNE